MFKKSVLSVLLLLMLFSATAFAQNENLMQTGEYLEYEVSFMGVKLGIIKTFIEPAEVLNGKPVYKVRCTMKSYDGIPFMDLNAKFESWLDKSVNFSHSFASNIKKSEGWQYQKLDFNYPEKYFNFGKWLNSKPIETKKITTYNKWNDGSSLFFLARKNLHLNKTIKVPTVIDEDTCFTTIKFTNKKEMIDIDAVDYPIRTSYFSGKAEWEGIYGLKGSFEGWFSDDEAAVPILAKMNVVVGNVRIELKKWKRANWAPPR